MPEPELALADQRDGRDRRLHDRQRHVSSRTIEGENPLYLPQAKVYSKCAGLGPVIALAWEPTETGDLAISLTITRDGKRLLRGRDLDEADPPPVRAARLLPLPQQRLPDGVFLMTGTGIVPPSEFTLEDGDHVAITIEGIGTLENPVVRHELTYSTFLMATKSGRAAP